MEAGPRAGLGPSETGWDGPVPTRTGPRADRWVSPGLFAFLPWTKKPKFCVQKSMIVGYIIDPIIAIILPPFFLLFALKTFTHFALNHGGGMGLEVYHVPVGMSKDTNQANLLLSAVYFAPLDAWAKSI